MGPGVHTSLNDRYFYQNFSDRDELLSTVWDGIKDDLLANLLRVLTEDPNRAPMDTLGQGNRRRRRTDGCRPGWAQIMFGRHLGSAVLEQRRTAVLHTTNIMVGAAGPHLKPGVDEMGLRVDALVGIGGFVELITAWQSGLIDVDAEQIIAQCSRIGVTLASVYLITG